MNPQRKTVGRRFLCVLVAALVSLLLVVLPFAQTLDASDSGWDSGRNAGGTVLQDSGAPDFQYEDADIIVTANLSGNTKIPADAELCVEPITQEKDSAAYKDVETQVNKDVTADHQTVTGFRAYDIYFSGNGTRYEPEAGDATVSIQYKDRVFDSAVKKATDEIKVLHLKKSDGKTKVENVTKAVDVKDLGGEKAKKTNSSSEAIKDGLLNGDSDAVEFVTKSFSTFVVTGVTNSSATINAAMSFYDVSGIVDQTVNGNYYLYIECSNYNGTGKAYRNTVLLGVTKGTVNTTMSGLYDQNGKPNSSTGKLYPLVNSSSGTAYTAILFTSTRTVPLDGSFQWDNSTMTVANGYTKYEPSSVISNSFLLNYIPTVTVSGGSGTLTIAATAQASSISADSIMRWLTPTLPFGAFTNYIHLQGDNESCFAANKAYLQNGDIGNSQNDAKYYAQTSNTINQNTITVSKTYVGSSQKTFRFGLYYKGSPAKDDAGNAIIKGLTLPNGGQYTGSVTFGISGITSSSDYNDYTIYELDSSGNKIAKGQVDSKDGFILTDMVQGSIQSSNSTTLNSTSYINSFDPNSTGGKLKEPDVNGTPQNHLVIGTNALTPWSGSIVTRNTYGFTIPCGNNNAILYSDNGTCAYASPANPMPDFSSVLDQMAILSTELAQVAANSSTVTVKRCTSDKLNLLKKGDFAIPSGSGNMLLVNIDATNSGSSFDISTAIRDNDVWALDNSGIDKSWVPTAGNVVVNIYKKVGGSCVPYDGTITNACFLYGTILAPRATIHTGAVFNGRLIGNEVYNDGNEIHSTAPGIISSNRTDQFTNKECSFTLPATGGGGTAIFYTTGGAVLLFGAVLTYVYQMNGKRRHIRKRRHQSLNE